MNDNKLQSPEEIETEVNMDDFRYFASTYTSENEYRFNDVRSEDNSGLEISRKVYDMKESRRAAGNTYENWSLEIHRDGEDLRYTAETEIGEGKDYPDEEHPPDFTNFSEMHPEPEVLRQEGVLEVTGEITEEGLEYLLE